jgi:hypothetical protein
MNVRRVALLAFLTAGSCCAQLVHVTLEGDLIIHRHDFPWLPVTGVSGPLPFRIDASYDAALPVSSDEAPPGKVLFFPENGIPGQEFQIRFDDVNWTVPLRQIDQGKGGDFELFFYDRFSFIHPVIHFGEGALGNIDRLIRPTFPPLSPDGSRVGDLEGFMIGIGDINGPITSVHAEFAPVPEPSAFAVASVALLIGAVFFRRRRNSHAN